MYCKNCGTKLIENTKFCGECGALVAEKANIQNTNNDGIQENATPEYNIPYGRAGFSTKINDPAFAKYLKNSNRWAGMFSVIIAIVAIIGFYIYGETSSEMSNPQALYIGFGIGGMFVLVALIQVIGRKKSKTWDGVVIDKTIKNKKRRQSTGSEDSDYYWLEYIEYKVIIKNDQGKKYEITAEDDTTQYNYYQIGDRIRHHAGLNSYEKYDKSKDSIIFCAACGTLNQIEADYCHRCKCPLLK